ncbi:hypothetical protein F5Y05DRAFT_387640 [Hypoxylon sp. FL0543]|nr:hypothetical protein F5Y05DRAFT_387640 [Hypoxylon sp. FL0543]
MYPPRHLYNLRQRYLAARFLGISWERINMSLRDIDPQENRRRMGNGELYFAFVPDLTADRRRCARTCERYNTAGEVDRRKLVELFHARHPE